MTGSPAEKLPATDRSTEKVAGHWLLARLGKRVLRPGGAELTGWLVAAAGIGGSRVVEFAPGLGRTAELLLERGPATYTGVDSDERAVQWVRSVVGDRGQVTQGDAHATGLVDGGADVVLGEAMLTMQTDPHKREIVAEARRLLAPGGRYAIHELAIVPDEAPDAVKTELRLDLARSIRVNARPLTVREWHELLTAEGFAVERTELVPMALLEPRRLVADEGLRGALRFVGNVLRDADARRRVLAMRRSFRKHRRHLAAIGVVATVRPD